MPASVRANILVVDDLPQNLLVLQTILQELDQNIVTARSGDEALQRVLEYDFAVVLLDVNMPGTDGFETAQLIRRRKRSAHTPIIFTTAFPDELHKAQGYLLGAVDYILSPIVPEVLRTKVRVFVELYQMTEQVKRQAEERVALAREQAARAAAEEATRRSAFLAEASKALASSLNVDVSMRGLMRVTVPFLADLGLITLLDDQGGIWQSEVAWIDSAHGVRTLTLPRSSNHSASLPDAHRRVLASGKSEVVREEWLVLHGQENTAFPGFAAHSALILPLLARGRPLGTLTLALAFAGRRFAAADIVLAEDLAARVSVAIDNAILYRDVQEADRKKNEFLAMLSHELRNPLASISNAVHILRLSGSDESIDHENQDLIERQVQQLVRLVDDLLDISRITRGKIRLQMQVVQVATVVAQAVESSKLLLDSRQHNLDLSLPEDPVWLEADPFRLSQVVGNLLNNAAKYTEVGGRVWLTVTREGAEAAIRIRDNGVGIPGEMLSSIFDLFTQVDRSLDRSEGGLGIGLTLVKRLVEMHGGNVRAYSDGPGRGSEFVVRLPALPGRKAGTAAPHAAALPYPANTGRRVLIVEDNHDAARSLAKLLRLTGHEVLICHDGPSALAQVEAYGPDAVLLDIGLPGMDGYEVATRLRHVLEPRRPLLIALTGYGQEEDLRKTKEAGFDHHLVKPIDPTTLADLLATSNKAERELRS